MTMPGRVLVRFLQPIMPAEASNKEEMSRLVRRRMLRALRDCPEHVGAEISWERRLMNVTGISALLAFNIFAGHAAMTYLFTVRKLTGAQVAMYGILSSGAITLTLYIYVVYVRKWLRRGSRKLTSKST